MTNVKLTKRTLLASVITMLICFTMLIGTTFAWFTDSVESAGNLEVGVEYTLDGENWEDLDVSTVVTIEDCEFNGCQPGDQNKYIYESDTDVTTFKFVETNNTVK